MGLRERAFQAAFRAMEAGNRRFANGRVEFFDDASFPWVRDVEARWRDVRGEMERVTRRVEALPNFQDVQQEQRDLTTDDRWKVFPFVVYGTPFEPNLALCPKTAETLKLIPGLRTAMFSVLRGPKAIPAHRGPFNGVLRYHLALTVPGDPKRCRIRVGSSWRTWQEGKSLVFDDTFEHEVVNDNPGERVVLFVDFLRTAPKALGWLNERMVDAIRDSSFIQDALSNLERWNVDFKVDEADARRAGPR